jgi:hypothetical protein
MTYLPDRESSDEVADARRLTSRDIAGAWGLALIGLVSLAAFGGLVCPLGRSDAAIVASEQQRGSCWCAAAAAGPAITD